MIFSGAVGVGEFSLPSISAPSIYLPKATSSAGAKLVSEPQPPSAADEARAKIRAMQAAKLEEKRLANEERLAERAGKISAKVAKTVQSTPAEADSYEALFSKATSAGPQAVAAAKKVSKKAEKESTATVDKATLADADVKKALEEAKMTEAAAKNAKAEAEAAAKQEAVDQKIAAQKSAEAAKIKVQEEMAEVEALNNQVRGD